MSKIKTYIWGIIIALAFFVIGVATLSHYGVNIDEPIHFIRGHAYLNFLLTGNKEYDQQDLIGPQVSIWKIQQYNAAYFFENDEGHPPLNGILAAATNRIFFEKLALLGDLEAYHLFEVFVSSLLVFLVYLMIAQHFGVFAGIVAALSLSLYPLFLGESHFNIKDPVEASFFSFTLYFLYLGLKKAKARYFLYSSFFCALAFGTKFNVTFIFFIITPYLVIQFFPTILKKKFSILKGISKEIYFSLFLYPLIVIAVWYLARPYLWVDPVGRFLKIFGYYRGMGTGKFYQPDYLVGGWNTYPVIFVAASTPLVTFCFFLVGLVIALSRLKREKHSFSLLLLIWLIVPILRVSWPGMSIYSGVRQIMEYIPAMAGLSGLGGSFIREKLAKILKNSSLASIVVLACFIPLAITLIRFHPNENVFLNSLVGGLRGAVERKLPGAGETMGNVYLQGIWWLNENAEENARFGLPVGKLSNIPRQFLRPDIKMGPYISGIIRNGEYMMEMQSVDFPPKDFNYNIQYLKRFLMPVHTIKVDGVPLFYIWKNDKEHTRPGFLEETKKENLQIEGGREDEFIRISLEEPSFLARMEIDYQPENCTLFKNEANGLVVYSPSGEEQIALPADLYDFEKGYKARAQEKGFTEAKNRFHYFFPGIKAKWIQIYPDISDSCLFQYEKIRLFTLENLKE